MRDCETCTHMDLPSFSATCVECGIAMKNYQRKSITNADAIRSMTDEELADLYMRAIEDEEYPGWWGNRMGLLLWLKQEVSADG